MAQKYPIRVNPAAVESKRRKNSGTGIPGTARIFSSGIDVFSRFRVLR
jgi:hypothetical protein